MATTNDATDTSAKMYDNVPQPLPVVNGGEIATLPRNSKTEYVNMASKYAELNMTRGPAEIIETDSDVSEHDDEATTAAESTKQQYPCLFHLRPPVTRGDDNHIYEYVKPLDLHRKRKRKSTKCVRALIMFTPLYLLLLTGILVLFMSKYYTPVICYNTNINSSDDIYVPHIECATNLLTSDIEFLSILASRAFMDTFQPISNDNMADDATYSVTEEERRKIITASLVNAEISLNNRSHGHVFYNVHYYVDEILRYSRFNTCCSDRICQFAKFVRSVLSNGGGVGIYLIDNEVLYKNVMFIQKFFLDAYFIVRYQSYYDTETQAYEKLYTRPIVYGFLTDANFNYSLLEHFYKYLENNKFCKK